MEALVKSAFIIEKEMLPCLVFPENEVLSDKAQIETRLWRLQKAIKMGNWYRDKVKIVFEDSVEVKAVNTTVWDIHEGKVLLKNGLFIPLHRVYEVVFD